jgi:MoxR-like ATPase
MKGAAMKPSDVSSRLARLIPARLPVLLVGPPGVGKSDVVSQACAAAGVRCEVFHPAVSDPTDYKGLPA